MSKYIGKMVDNVMREVKRLTEKYPSRLTGEDNTLKCADELKDYIKESIDRVFSEDFYVHPGAFLGWIKIVVVFYVVSLIFLWSYNIFIPFILSVVFLLIFIFQFVLFGSILDPFYKKVVGRNVVGIVEPMGSVRGQVIVSGHHDSAHIFNFFEHFPKLYPIRIFGAMGTVFGLFFYSLVGVVLYFLGDLTNDFFDVGKWAFLILSPFVLELWFFYSKKGTPGAGDNLASSLVAFEIAKYFYDLKKEGKGLKNTRVIAISFDAEEAGLRGARAFVKKHLEELKAVPTYVYNLEVLYNKDELAFTITDVNDTVKLSEKLADEGVEIAKKLGYTQVEKIKFGFMNGGTDAGEFGRRGIEATTFQGMRISLGHRAPAYHTLRDTYEAVDKEAVKAAIEIGIKLIEKKDKDLAI